MYIILLIACIYTSSCFLQVYIIDSFLVQGPKILVRVGLIVFSQFAKFIEKEGTHLILKKLLP